MTAFIGRLRPRRVTSQAGSDVAAAATALTEAKAPLLTGRFVQFRTGQMLLWSVVAGLIGASFVAGLYDGLFEVRWYVHVGSFNHGTSLKLWWDSGMGWIRSGNWPTYRHAIRDIAEPAFATMAVQTLLAKPKWWKVRVSTARIVTAPLVIIAVTIGLCVLGVYLLNFGIPGLWHRAFGSYVLPDTAWLGVVSAGQLVLGFLIGRVLHRYWAPIGATLQGNMLDRSVDFWQGKIARVRMSLEEAVDYSNRGLHILPVWQRRPLAPPVLRERWAMMWRDNVRVDVHSRHAKVIGLVLLVAAVVTLLGFAGHYYVGALHHSIPYLFPGAQ